MLLPLLLLQTRYSLPPSHVTHQTLPSSYQTLSSTTPHAVQTSLSFSAINNASSPPSTDIVSDSSFTTILPLSNNQHVISLKLMNTNYLY